MSPTHDPSKTHRTNGASKGSKGSTRKNYAASIWFSAAARPYWPPRRSPVLLRSRPRVRLHVACSTPFMGTLGFDYSILAGRTFTEAMNAMLEGEEFHDRPWLKKLPGYVRPGGG